MNKLYIIPIALSLLFSQEIGFVGDSTTDNYYPGYTGGWFTDATIIKYAAPGYGVIRAPYLYKDTQKYQDVLNRRPEFTIMLLGSDDFWVYSGREIEWRTEYTYLVNTLRLNSNLILGTILYRLYEPTADAPIQAMNTVIKEIANNLGLIVADFNSALGKNANYYIGDGFIDGIHPNDSGQRKMAEYAKNAILQHNPNTDTTPPAVPSDFSAVAGDNQVTLSWAENQEPDMDKYYLFRDIVVYERLGTGLKTFNKNRFSYTDTTVHNNTTYYYFLAAGDTAENRSKKTDAVSATPIDDVIPPDAPTITSASAFQGGVKLEWTPNSEPDLANYYIYGSTTSGFYPALSDSIAAVNKLFIEYVDSTNIEPHLDYYYRISAIDRSGNESGFSDEAAVTTLRILNDNLTTAYVLKQNTPNPFNPATSIEYTIPFDTKVNIVIYDLMGNEIKTLINDYREVGQYTINWDGTNHTGQFVSGGIYFYKLQAGDFIQTKKMVLLR